MMTNTTVPGMNRPVNTSDSPNVIRKRIRYPMVPQSTIQESRDERFILTVYSTEYRSRDY